MQMTLETNFIPLVITGLFTVSIIASCGTHEQKPDDAFELAKKERMLLKDSDSLSKEIIQESKKTEVIKKNEYQDEWTRYKIEMEKKIRTNGNTIKEIKALGGINANLIRKAKSLEKENNDLRIKMDEYNEEVKVKWENFKTSMNHDVNEIAIELKAMKINK